MKRYSTIKQHNLKQLLLTILFSLAAFAHSNAQTLLYDFKFNNTLTDDVNGATFNSTLVANSTNYGFTDDRYNSTQSAWRNLNVVKLAANLPLLPQGNSARTIAFWVNQSANPYGTSFLWSYGTAAASQAFGIRQEFTNFNFYAWGNDNTTTAIPYSGGTWKHVAVSFDGATLRIYLNGTQVYSVAKTLNTTGTTFRIGVAVDDYQLGMLATIDDLKIYSGALTPAEILTLTQQPGNPNIANLSEQNITPYSADIHFDLSPNGSSNSTSIVYGTNSTSLNNTTAGGTYSGTGVNSASIALSNLSPVTRYYYKVMSVNAQGTFYSGLDSFFTLSNGAPSLGLLSYYNFENNLNAHNNAHNFSIPSGWNAPNYIPNGKVGKGLQSVDYNTVCVNTSMAPLLANTDFTYSFWYQLTELSSGNSPYPTLVESFSSMFWRYGQQSSMNAGMALSASNYPVFVSFIPTLNEWVHISMVKKEEPNGDHYLYLYINGNLYNSFLLGNGSINMYQFNNVFTLFGGTEANGSIHMAKRTRAILDELYIYNRAITPTEALLIYHNTTGVIQSTPLPLVFESFQAFNQKEQVLLQWATSQEKNTNSFLVQRSSNVKDWETIANVNVVSTNRSLNNYTEYDRHPLVGKSYYRIVSIDLDEQKQTSEIKGVNRSSTATAIIFPNPANDVLYIQLAQEVLTKVTLFNATGQIVKQWQVNASGKVILDGLQNGHYGIHLTNDFGSETQLFQINHN